MYLKSVYLSMLSLLLLCAFAEPTLSISVSLSSEGGVQQVSSSTIYNLDKSATLNEENLLGSGKILQKRQANGSGNNSLYQQMNDGEHALTSAIKSSGQFAAGSSFSTSSGSSAFNQQVIGKGKLDTTISSYDGSSSSWQHAGVSMGILETKQNLIAEDSMLTSQETGISGSEGRISEAVITGRDLSGYSGAFLGASEMNAAISAGADGTAANFQGSISIDGATYLDQANGQTLSDKSGGMSVQGLHISENGLSSFNLKAFKMDRSAFDSMNEPEIRSEETTGNFGTHESYSLLIEDGYPMRWNTDDPIQLYLNDASLAGTGISVDEAKWAIDIAANTWDSAVAKNLFADGETVKSSSFDPNDHDDGFSVHGWGPLDDLENGKLTLAVVENRWENPKVDGYWSIKESDAIYNNQFYWPDLDVQTVALHNLGNTIGLGEVEDPNQVMYHEYLGVNRDLNIGDIYGAQSLYGAGLGLIGDFDGDGMSDIVEINGGDNIITSYSDGYGWFDPTIFTPWTGYNTGLGTWGVSDVNGDGKDDLQHIWGGDYINTWISNGDGTYYMRSFQPWQGYATNLGSWATDDVNGDGKDDLQHIWGGDYLNTWISKGDGTYQMQSFQPWPGYVTSVGGWATADVNGDSKSDLQHIWGGDYVNTWISKGDGTYQMQSFQPWQGYATGHGVWDTGDVDGDGRSDLQHIWGGDYINTWISKGDGTYEMRSFQPWPGYATSPGSWLLGDINGDGKDDLQHIWGGDYFNTWISKGDGTYQMNSFQPWLGYDAAFGEFFTSDFDGDGMDDILHLFGGDYPYYYLWTSNGDGTFHRGWTVGFVDP